MILDQIENLRQYASLHPGIAGVVQFIASNDLPSLPLGKHEIDGRRVFVIRDMADGKDLAGARLEVHRGYIDIQIALDRPELIGYSPLARCHQVSQPYDDAGDIEFFADCPESWITLSPGSFALFFPADAHAPLAIRGKINKAVFKLEIRS
jgi:YhcH/YjgK/YiaL family protein